MVWCGITAGRVLGPYFFEDETENAIAITGKRYQEKLENFVHPAVLDTPEVCLRLADGATTPLVHPRLHKANFWENNNFAKF